MDRFTLTEVLVTSAVAVVALALVAHFVGWSEEEVVIHDQKVMVVNNEPVENIDRRFSFGDECFLRPRGEVMRDLRVRQVVLMEYRPPKGKPETWDSCPSGTFFLGPLQD